MVFTENCSRKLFTGYFDCPWGKLKYTEEYLSMSLDEKIEYLYRTLFGDNPDENDPKFKEFDTGIKLFREELKKEEDSYRL